MHYKWKHKIESLIWTLLFIQLQTLSISIDQCFWPSLDVDSSFLHNCKRQSFSLPGRCLYICCHMFFPMCAHSRCSWINYVDQYSAARRSFLKSNCWCTWLLQRTLNTKSILAMSGVKHRLHHVIVVVVNRKETKKKESKKSLYLFISLCLWYSLY